MRLMKPFQRMMLLLSLCLCLSGMTACAPKVVAVPDSREIIDLSKGSEPKPGWYGISGGYLREIYRDCGIKDK